MVTFVEKVLTVLQDADISAMRACPGQHMTAITEPTVTVALQSGAPDEQTVTILTTVFVPAVSGQAVCEEMAVQVAQLVSGIGGSCRLKQCDFDGRLGLFVQEITGQFQTDRPTVKLNGKLLPYASAFTCWRSIDPDAGIVDLEDAPWEFRLEEFFPANAISGRDDTEPFALLFISQDGSESYRSCHWTYWKRIWSATGVRQIRLGTSTMMTLG